MRLRPETAARIAAEGKRENELARKGAAIVARVRAKIGRSAVADARHLYVSGWSPGAISEKLGVHYHDALSAVWDLPVPSRYRFTARWEVRDELEEARFEYYAEQDATRTHEVPESHAAHERPTLDASEYELGEVW